MEQKGQRIFTSNQAKVCHWPSFLARIKVRGINLFSVTDMLLFLEHKKKEKKEKYFSKKKKKQIHEGLIYQSFQSCV